MLIFNEVGGGGTMVGNRVVVGWGEGELDIYNFIVVCETWTLQQGSSIAHYYVVTLDNY